MKNLLLATAFLAASVFGASAAEKLKVTETVKLEAAPAKVWERIGHFYEFSWHPAIKASATSDGDKPGSQRRLDLGGPILWESLVSHDKAAMHYQYRILDNGENQKVVPVTHYVSTLMVKPDGQGSEVVWSSEFDPTPGTEPEAAKKAIAGIYRGGLDNIAKALATN